MSQLHSIQEDLASFLRQQVLADDVQFGPDTSLTALSVDSFSLMELVLFIERKYGISIPDSHLTQERMQSVRTLAECVHELSQRGRT